MSRPSPSPNQDLMLVNSAVKSAKVRLPSNSLHSALTDEETEALMEEIMPTLVSSKAWSSALTNEEAEALMEQQSSTDEAESEEEQNRSITSLCSFKSRLCQLSCDPCGSQGHSEKTQEVTAPQEVYSIPKVGSTRYFTEGYSRYMIPNKLDRWCLPPRDHSEEQQSSTDEAESEEEQNRSITSFCSFKSRLRQLSCDPCGSQGHSEKTQEVTAPQEAYSIPKVGSTRYFTEGYSRYMIPNKLDRWCLPPRDHSEEQQSSTDEAESEEEQNRSSTTPSRGAAPAPEKKKGTLGSFLRSLFHISSRRR